MAGPGGSYPPFCYPNKVNVVYYAIGLPISIMVDYCHLTDGHASKNIQGGSYEV